jgi:hypothetical protein
MPRLLTVVKLTAATAAGGAALVAGAPVALAGLAALGAYALLTPQSAESRQKYKESVRVAGGYQTTQRTRGVRR